MSGVSKIDPLLCTHCKQKKKKKDFGRTKDTRKGGLDYWCKECRREAQRKYQAERRRDPEVRATRNEQAKAARRAYFGLVDGDYEVLFQVQNGVCAGCFREPVEGRSLDIDHEHQLQEKDREPWERFIKLRGLLCHRCNRLLGLAGDDSGVLRRLADYLDDPPARRMVIQRWKSVYEYLKAFEARKP